MSDLPDIVERADEAFSVRQEELRDDLIPFIVTVAIRLRARDAATAEDAVAAALLGSNDIDALSDVRWNVVADQ